MLAVCLLLIIDYNPALMVFSQTSLIRYFMALTPVFRDPILIFTNGGVTLNSLFTKLCFGSLTLNLRLKTLPSAQIQLWTA